MSIRRISNFFGRHQFLKSTLIAGGLMGSGDVISQLVIERVDRNNYNYIRTLRFTAIGFFFVGPIIHNWYKVLDKIVLRTKAATAITRMILDQAVVAPPLFYCFFWINGGLQGIPASRIQENLRRDYFDILITNYKIWPAAQLINFWIIPLHHRVLFAQSLALLWNVYLAWKVNR